MQTKYILEYRYEGSEDNDWRVEDEYSSPADAQRGFTEHVRSYAHIMARLRKVVYTPQESVVADFRPMFSDEFDD